MHGTLADTTVIAKSYDEETSVVPPTFPKPSCLEKVEYIDIKQLYESEEQVVFGGTDYGLQHFIGFSACDPKQILFPFKSV
jgi:hypothetical protein